MLKMFCTHSADYLNFCALFTPVDCVKVKGNVGLLFLPYRKIKWIKQCCIFFLICWPVFWPGDASATHRHDSAKSAQSASTSVSLFMVVYQRHKPFWGQSFLITHVHQIMVIYYATILLRYPYPVLLPVHSVSSSVGWSSDLVALCQQKILHSASLNKGSER